MNRLKRPAAPRAQRPAIVLRTVGLCGYGDIKWRDEWYTQSGKESTPLRRTRSRKTRGIRSAEQLRGTGVYGDETGRLI